MISLQSMESASVEWHLEKCLTPVLINKVPNMSCFQIMHSKSEISNCRSAAVRWLLVLSWWKMPRSSTAVSVCTLIWDYGSPYYIFRWQRRLKNFLGVNKILYCIKYQDVPPSERGHIQRGFSFLSFSSLSPNRHRFKRKKKTNACLKWHKKHGKMEPQA